VVVVVVVEILSEVLVSCLAEVALRQPALSLGTDGIESPWHLLAETAACCNLHRRRRRSQDRRFAGSLELTMPRRKARGVKTFIRKAGGPTGFVNIEIYQNAFPLPSLP